MLELYDIEKRIRHLVRYLDSNPFTKQEVLECLVKLADEYQDRAEEMELKMIVEDQMRPDHPRYDYGLK